MRKFLHENSLHILQEVQEFWDCFHECQTILTVLHNGDVWETVLSRINKWYIYVKYNVTQLHPVRKAVNIGDVWMVISKWELSDILEKGQSWTSCRVENEHFPKLKIETLMSFLKLIPEKRQHFLPEANTYTVNLL